MHSYALTNKPIVVSNSKIKESEYSLIFRDIPSEDRPREKLLAQGSRALSSAELLALILNTGTKKEDVLMMSNRVLKEYGEKSLAGKTDPKQFAEDLDIPLIKAIQIVACAELGRRFFSKKSGKAATLRTAKDVFEYAKDMRTLSKEHLRGIYLNSHYRVIHDEVLSIGTIDANLVHPREVFRPAIENSAAAVILVHNHPSNDHTPSQADKEITRQIIEAGEIIGIPLLDHIVVTSFSYKSIQSI